MLEFHLQHPEAYRSGSFKMTDYDPMLPYERAFDKGKSIVDYLSNTSVSQGIHDLRGILSNAYNSLQANYQGIKHKTINFLNSLKPFEIAKLRTYLGQGLELSLAFAGDRVNFDYFSRKETEDMAGVGYNKLKDMYGSKAGPALDALHKKHKGFTLIELLVVIAIIGILAAMLLPSLTGARTRAKDMSEQVTMQNLSMAMWNYNSDWKPYWASAWNEMGGIRFDVTSLYPYGVGNAQNWKDPYRKVKVGDDTVLTSVPVYIDGTADHPPEGYGRILFDFEGENGMLFVYSSCNTLWPKLNLPADTQFLFIGVGPDGILQMDPEKDVMIIKRLSDEKPQRWKGKQ